MPRRKNTSQTIAALDETKFIDTYIGHGVFVQKEAQNGEMILEYTGKLIENPGESESRTLEWRFFFQHQGKTFCIDASDGLSMARMVNDATGKNVNSKMKKIIIDEKPRLFLYALRDLVVGEELLYDYGVGDLPWRKLMKKDKRSCLYQEPKSVVSGWTEHDPEGLNVLGNQSQPHESPDMLGDQSQPPEGPDMLGDQSQQPECPDVLGDQSQPHEGPDMLGGQSQPPEGPDMLGDQSQPPEGPDVPEDQSQPPEGSDVLGDQSQPHEGPDIMLDDQAQSPEGPDMLDDQSQPLGGPNAMLDDQTQTQLRKEAMIGHHTVDTRQVSTEEEIILDVTDKTMKDKGNDGDETEAADGHCRRVFVCSGSRKVKEQLKQLVNKCGGELVPEFQANTTHVVMQADEPRCCNRSLKYFLGIAHHCWVLDHRYVGKCLEAGLYLPEGEYEIVGDEVFPNGHGTSLSRQTRKKILSGLKMRFTGDSRDFSKEDAGDIVLSLGKEVDITSSFVISTEDKGKPSTVSRNWLFDSLSSFTLLKMDLYYSGIASSEDDMDEKSSLEKGEIPSKRLRESEDVDSEDPETRKFRMTSVAQMAKRLRKEPANVHRISKLDSESLSSIPPRPIIGTQKTLSIDDKIGVASSEDDMDEKSSLEKGEIPSKRLRESEDVDSEDPETRKFSMTSVAQKAKRLRKEPANVQRISKLDSESLSSIPPRPIIGTQKTLSIDDKIDVENLGNGSRRPFDEQMETDDEEFAEDSYDDDDYFPSEESDSDSESTVYPVQDTVAINIEKGLNVAQASRDKEQVEMENSSIPVMNVQQETIHIATSKKTEDGKRIWDKKYVCIYCMNHYAKLARHLEQVHAKEFEVQRALAYDKNSAARKQVWREIMNKGDFAHNSKVLENQKGEIIPFKRPSKVTAQMKYVQCESCLGTFLGSDLWRHVKKCHPDKKEKSTKLKRYHQESSAALLPVSSEAAKNFREIILNRMTNDSISLIARNDCEIVGFGQKMFKKHAKNPHQHQYIRQKMRELARFLTYVRAANHTMETLRDCIDSTKFGVCVEAVKELCGYNEGDFTFKVPSLAKKLGHSLHRVARQLKVKAAKTGDEDLIKKAKHFIEVYLEDWDSEISHAAAETLETKKYNKAARLPIAEDLKTLTTHLKDKAEMLTKTFESSDATEVEWRQLCEVTLAQVVLFNKRRSGEAERLEVNQYINGIKQGKTNQEELMQSLSHFEKQLYELIDRVEVRGKRGRRVAILLPTNLRKQLDILVKNRAVGHINASNKYMFARAGEAEFPVRASDVLRKYAIECGAKHPELLSSTYFRKHIAVIVQMLNLKKNWMYSLDS